MLKIFKPFVSEKAKKYCLEVLNSDQLAEGPFVKRFEEAFSKKFNFKNVCALNSGTSALELAYELAGVKENDEIIVPVLTCTATNLPILHRGATPVFADINNDLVIDPKDVEHRITKKTKAIVYVHFGGYAGGLKKIQEIAAKYNIPVIEDAAQSVGSKEEWGTSEFVCVSLQAIKTLTAGDGGILMCKDDKLHAKAKRLRWFGYDRDEKQRLGDTDLLEAGYKYHMNDISAAIALGNLEELDEVLEKREKIRQIYENSGLTVLSRQWLVIFLGEKVKDVEKMFAEEGLKLSGYHYRNDKYTVFGGRRKDLPYMDMLEGNYTLLPFHHDITQDEAEEVVKKIKQLI